MFQILEVACTKDITSCCSDYGIATYITTIKQILDIIHIIVPIILIVMGIVDFTKLIINADDNGGKIKKSILNKAIATFIIFFIPYIITLVMTLLTQTSEYSGFKFELGRCWESAENITTMMAEQKEYDDAVNNYTQIQQPTYSGVKPKKDSKTVKKNKKSSKKNKNKSSSKSNKSAGSSDKSDELVKYAKKFVGNKYVYGGCSMTNGTDCSCFVKNVYHHFGYELPRTAASQASACKNKVSLKNLKKGDLLYYMHGSNIGHVTMYIGNNKVVHASNPAPYPRGGIIISPVTYRTPSFACRIIKD